MARWDPRGTSLKNTRAATRSLFTRLLMASVHSHPAVEELSSGTDTYKPHHGQSRMSLDDQEMSQSVLSSNF
ncbi:hypothetical protein BS47DRAFT_1393398 [Hydnum rufescens UP504]|uniref:Uncharacterized protein n=1 Tax=Hydnum rufescens UP504 TaxID=1448309 RepID=A0A9P6AYV0_9AGAM|nr:hypothetical protein BS47DRAFT_1393398 [Hydnum rufescens UP504]